MTFMLEVFPKYNSLTRIKNLFYTIYSNGVIEKENFFTAIFILTISYIQ